MLIFRFDTIKTMIIHGVLFASKKRFIIYLLSICNHIKSCIIDSIGFPAYKFVKDHSDFSLFLLSEYVHFETHSVVFSCKIKKDVEKQA